VTFSQDDVSVQHQPLHMI